MRGLVMFKQSGTASSPENSNLSIGSFGKMGMPIRLHEGEIRQGQAGTAQLDYEARE